MRHVEHRFTGPSYTLGIEEELMIVDAETLDLANSIEGLLDDLERDRHGGRGQARADGVGVRDRHHPVRQRGRGRRAAAGAAAPGAASGGGARPRDRLGRHAPVRAVGGPADRLAPALPRPDRRPPVRRPPGDHLRHPRARGDRRPGQGDPRDQRHARAPAAAARALRELALLARRPDRASTPRARRSSAPSREWASRPATTTSRTGAGGSSSW